MKPIYIQQRDQTDCGVACLLSVIRMYGGNASLESLREHSGTSLQGTSLLGLQQAAEQQNINAEAFEVDDLSVFQNEAKFPCILHVLIDEKLEHYVICYATPAQNQKNAYQIIDPAKGFEEWSEAELLERWKSKALLCLTPNFAFEKQELNQKKQWLWLKALIAEDLPLLSIAAGLGVIIAVLGLATSIFSQKLIDEILPNKEVNRLWTGIGLLTVLLFAKSGISYLRSFFLLRQSKDFNSRIMGEFYEKLLHLPKTFFDTRKVGEIIARLNDTRRIQGLISFLAGNVVIDALVFIISAVFIFTYTWQLGLFILLSIPVFSFLVYKYHTGILSGQKDVMAAYAASESHFVDAISGIEPIKLANKVPFFFQIGKSIYANFQQKIYTLGSLGNRYNFWNEAINGSFIIVVLSIASYMVLEEELMLGELMAILSISLGLVGAVSRLTLTNIQLQEARVAFDRMYEFASIKAEVENDKKSQYNEPGLCTSGGGVRSLVISDLSFRFAGKKLLLENINLNLKHGQIKVLMGEVGSGKSILLQLIQKFRDFENGEIIINDNQSLKEIGVEYWRSKLGVVPQEIKLFSGTLLDNITLGNIMEEGEKTIQFCKEYGFDVFFETLPQNYLTIVGEEGINLSGGQRQLVGLARALYGNPDVLLLDEPTSAMDSKTERFVFNLLSKIKKDKMILMITHRQNFGDLAEEVIELKDGKIINLKNNVANKQ